MHFSSAVVRPLGHPTCNSTGSLDAASPEPCCPDSEHPDDHHPCSNKISTGYKRQASTLLKGCDENPNQTPPSPFRCLCASACTVPFHKKTKRRLWVNLLLNVLDSAIAA